MAKENKFQDGIAELSTQDGVAFIEQASPLTRLHYFDGKFLRADAFAQEQDYHRARTRLSNLAGGWGAVNGLGISLNGNQLTVGAGLAITAAGNFVLATGDMHADIADLLEVAAPAPTGGNPEFDACFKAPKKGVKETTGLHIYEITAGPVEGLCGSEAVYGKLCESACASDSQHPYWREGVVLRLRPIGLQLPGSPAVTLSAIHLRNRVASAYFAAEPWLTPGALSATGLASDLWCNPASLYGRDEVVIGLLVREAGVNRVLDAWSGRRERMDTQARGYWQGRMAMRPWNVFTAQILQFQCQLAGLFDKVDKVLKPSDECGQLRLLLDKTRKEIEALHKKYSEGAQKILKQFGEKPTKQEALSIANEVKASYAELYEISSALSAADLGKGVLPKRRMLLDSGFVELPPAGYLPVSPGKVSVEEQCSRLFGEGVRLHYHAVRADEIAHLVEEAQHLERISLTRGIDNPKLPEEVEIFVPDGKMIDARAQATGTWWQVDMRYEAVRALDLVVTDNGDSRLALRDQALAQASEASQAALSLIKGERAGKAKALTINTNVAALNTDAGMAVNQLSSFNWIHLPTLTGLARTESREEGSYGFTLAAAPDALEMFNTGYGQQASLAYHLKADFSGNLEASPQDTARKLAFYCAGDIAKDPFDLPMGGETGISAEMRLMSGLSTVVTVASGQLTVLSQRSAANGAIERLVQADVLSHHTVFGRMEGPETRTERTRLRFNILRKGDSDAGKFVLDDEKHDAESSPVFFEWDDSPRRAAMFILAAQDQGAIIHRIMKLMSRQPENPPVMAVPEPAASAEAPAPAATGEASALTRQQLLDMNALAGIPAITGADGVAAMNTLVALADATDDPAFLARARRRLFPALEAPAASEVRAIHDWVMFRRARTPLRGPVCTRETAPAVEAFQVWHLKTDSAEQLKLLETALDKGDAKAMAQLKFQRVGILRYRNESAYSEESADRVRQMWQFAQPDAQVVIGRVWESAPATGQGWQNHFRLRNMLEQIASLTKPPVRGDGALAAIPAPPYPLADGALDGGMLVVTMAAAVQLKPHRVVLLFGNIVIGQILETLRKNPAQGMDLLNNTVADKANSAIDLSLQFSGDQLDASSKAALVEANAQMLKLMGMHETITFNTLLIKAAQIDSGVNLDARHKETLGNLGEANMHLVDNGAQTATANDLGSGAQGLTLVSYSPDPT